MPRTSVVSSAHEHPIGNREALIIRILFWGILYYNYNKAPRKIVLVII